MNHEYYDIHTMDTILVSHWGRELLHLQGLQFPAKVSDELTEVQKIDLAGNSYLVLSRWEKFKLRKAYDSWLMTHMTP